MRQMAGDRQHQVVMVGRHDLDLGAERGPERAQPLDRGTVSAFGRGQDAPAVDEELGETGIGTGMLGAGNRMRRNEVHAFGQMRRHVPHDRALDRADVGDDRARLEMRRDFLRHRPAGADGNAENDEIGVINSLRVGLHHAIDDAEFFHARAGLRRMRGGDDLARQSCSRAARAIEPPISPKPISATFGKIGAAFTCAAMKSRRPSTTRRLASSVPMVMRSACGRP